MKIRIERENWKALKRQIAIWGGTPFSLRGSFHFASDEPFTIEESGSFIRLCMDAPQVRLQGTGAYNYPMVDIAIRAALAILFGSYLYGYNHTVDMIYHMLNFTINGWTYGLICELAMLILYSNGLLFVGKLLLWAVLMKGVDVILADFIGGRYEINGNGRRSRILKDQEFSKPLSHTSRSALQNSGRPLAFIIITYLLFKPKTSNLWYISVALPTLRQLVCIILAMMYSFLYRLISYSTEKSDDRNKRKRPTTSERRKLWLKSIVLPTSEPAQWPYWFPVWLVLFILAGAAERKGPMLDADTTQQFLEFVLGMMIIAALFPIWSILSEWADGFCDAQIEIKEPKKDDDKE